jgi:hypothetical protein
VFAEQRTSTRDARWRATQYRDDALHTDGFAIQCRIRNFDDHVTRGIVRVASDIGRGVDPTGRHASGIHRAQHLLAGAGLGPLGDQTIQFQLPRTPLLVGDNARLPSSACLIALGDPATRKRRAVLTDIMVGSGERSPSRVEVAPNCGAGLRMTTRQGGPGHQRCRT